MPKRVNFFKQDCSCTLDEVYCWIVDLDDNNPAYVVDELAADRIDGRADSKVKVIGFEGKSALFYAIDKCLKIYRNSDSTELESLAEGVIEVRSTNPIGPTNGTIPVRNKYIFVELKSTRTRGWSRAGIDQLANTLRLFKAHHGEIAQSAELECQLSNRKRPSVNTQQSGVINLFAQNTGVVLRICCPIQL